MMMRFYIFTVLLLTLVIGPQPAFAAKKSELKPFTYTESERRDLVGWSDELREANAFLHRNKDVKKAQLLLEEAISEMESAKSDKDYERVEARLDLAYALGEQNKWQQALDVIEQAIPIATEDAKAENGKILSDDDYGKVLSVYAEALLKCGRSDDAQKALNKLSDFENGNLQSKYGRLKYDAERFADRGKTEEAEQLYRQALEVAEKIGPWHYRRCCGALGDYLSEIGNYKEAEEVFRLELQSVDKAIVAQADDPAYDRTKAYDKYFHELLLADFTFDVGISQFNQGKYDDAIANFDRSIALFKGSNPHAYRAMIARVLIYRSLAADLAGNKKLAHKSRLQSLEVFSPCPKCHSNWSVSFIVYGLAPVERFHIRRDCVRGGCVVYGSDPNLYCRKCDFRYSSQCKTNSSRTLLFDVKKI